MSQPTARRQRQIIVLLLLLLGARFTASVVSTAGIRWDFANYYQTARRVTSAELDNLYRLPASTMARFYERTGDRERQRAAEAAESRDGAELASGRMGFIGFPVTAYVFAPMGFLSPRSALLAFKLQGALFLVAALILIYPAFRDGTRDRLEPATALAAYLLVALVYAPFWFVFSTGGQATPLNLFLLAVFYRCFVAGSVTPAALALSLGILIKPFFVLMLPILALAGEWRLIARLVACLLAGAAVSILLLGWPLHAEWIAVMRDAGAGLAEPWWNNSGVFASVYAVWLGARQSGLAPAGEAQGALAAGIVVAKVLILGVFATLARRVARADVESHARRHHIVAIAIVFALCFSNIVWPHYLAFLFLPLVFWLFPSVRLPRHAELLAWAVLLSTFAVQSRFAQRFVVSLLQEHPYSQAVVAGLFASATLLLTLALVLSSHDDLLLSSSGQGPVRARTSPLDAAGTTR